jgi:hypothetical protein
MQTLASYDHPNNKCFEAATQRAVTLKIHLKLQPSRKSN